MTKTTDQILFESIMRLPRVMRRRMFEHSEEGPMPFPPHMHHHPHGCGPEGIPPHGPTRPGKGPFSRERVLEALLDAEEGIRQKALAEALHINPSSMSEMIDRLEADHYLVRTVDPGDRRATLIHLTELGTARANELQDEKAERVSGLFQNLTEEEKLQLIHLIEKLTGSEKED